MVATRWKTRNRRKLGRLREKRNQEEVCIDIDTVNFLTATNDIFPEELHYITIFVKAKSYKGESKIGEPDKATAIGWYDWENLPTPLFLPLENLKKEGFNP